MIGNYIIGAVTVLYSLASVSYFWTDNWQKGLIFLGYVIANLGILAVK